MLQATLQTQDLVREVLRAAEVLMVAEYHAVTGAMKVAGPKRAAVLHHGMYLRQNWLKLERPELEAGYKRFCSTPDLLLYQSEPGMLEWLPNAVDIDELQALYPRSVGRSKPLVLHGATVETHKGTDRIMNELRRLDMADVSLVSGVRRREFLWHLRQADVYVATLLYGPGVATVEAWAMGVPVVLGCKPEELELIRMAYGRPDPFLYVKPNEVADAVRELIENEVLRAQLIERGYEAAELHRPTYVAKRLVRAMAKWPETNTILTRNIV